MPLFPAAEFSDMRMFFRFALLVVAWTPFPLGQARAAGEPPATQPTSGTSFLDNGSIRLGANLDLGGAITYLAKTGADSPNMINSWDWGRQIQMSFYSGPIPFTPGGRQPADVWRGLGWNPIQAGDHFHNRSRTLECRNDGKSIYIKCRPMQWPLDNVAGDCIFESRMRLEGNTVIASGRIIMHRDDATQYPARMQELPAIYTNGPWCKIVTYEGDKPFARAPLTQIPSTFPWHQWNATENWAALVNDQDQGVGIWEEQCNRFSGGFSGKPGAGGPADAPTGHLSPNHLEILDANIDYSYSYRLIVGSVDQIRNYVYAHAARLKPPAYRFDSDRQHWHYHDVADAGWPINGELSVKLAGPDPQLLGPVTFWNSSEANQARIEAAFDHTAAKARLRWRGFNDKNFTEEKTITFPIQADGKFHTYEINLAAIASYTGPMVQLRLDPVREGDEGTMRLKQITLARKPPG